MKCQKDQNYYIETNLFKRFLTNFSHFVIESTTTLKVSLKKTFMFSYLEKLLFNFKYLKLIVFNVNVDSKSIWRRRQVCRCLEIELEKHSGRRRNGSFGQKTFEFASKFKAIFYIAFFKFNFVFKIILIWLSVDSLFKIKR